MHYRSLSLLFVRKWRKVKSKNTTYTLPLLTSGWLLTAQIVISSSVSWKGLAGLPNSATRLRKYTQTYMQDG